MTARTTRGGGRAAVTRKAVAMVVFALAVASTLVLSAGPARAQERGGNDTVSHRLTVDLQLRRLPPPSTLTMRSDTARSKTDYRDDRIDRIAGHSRPGRQAAPAGNAVGRVAQSADPANGDQADATVSSGQGKQDFASAGYKAIPTTMRDLQERVIFRFNVGYGLDSGTLSGDPGRSGIDPARVTDPNGNEFTEFRNYLLGDAVLGSNGILMPSLNTYIQSRFAFDAVSGASEFTALPSSYDNQAFQINAAYAEFDGFGGEGTVLDKIFVRGGRQYRHGSALFVTVFDGITAAFDDRGIEVSGFFGQRASIYFDKNPGLVGGGGVKLRGKDLFDLPVDLAVDYLFFDGGGSVAENAAGGIALSRHYIELDSRLVLSSTRIYLRGRIVDNGDLAGQMDADGNIEADGIGLGRLGVQVRHPFGRKLLVVADAEQRFGRAVAYDFVSPVRIDVVDADNLVGIGLDPPADSTRVGVRVNAMLNRMFELYGFARVNIVSDADGQKTGFNRPYQDLGAALSARVGPSVIATAQYKLRLQQLNDDANGEGSDFFDTSGSGVTQYHELSGEFRYRLSGPSRRASAGLGAYFRVYNLQSPYAEVEQDSRAGGRVDVDYWFRRDLRVMAAGEIAQPSPSIAPELGTLLSIRLLTEALF